ncbi:hypothetical protein [Frankia sp. Cr1]|uniref:hypothetical protein n=1 Tax=Frankia sp. Cr1 TaxID=3073931 RepID=UPI002AD278AE|nr:hypothetical protein [Frankia sp. Cr1]
MSHRTTLAHYRHRAAHAVRLVVLAAAEAVLNRLEPATPATRPASAPTAVQVVESVAVDAPRLVVDPATVFSADELDALDPEIIAVSCGEFDQAADEARAADRTRRRAKKILDRLPAGLYGAWLVERVESNRLVADLDAVRATYQRLGLGDVPVKACAPGLRVSRAAGVPTGIETLVAVAA